ncbi:hypothetical protein SAMN04488128_103200 [Chitinophaga eiseniae]|uniref:Uncharacterized protein n=1 Tax=Chitinophaga eiseniae TaxID=634771 RepID=A0A1T4SQ28_9BACT|nr:hypothetical protein [Chitinophaga eiseniae]SKA29988.1 hypothetical protein SAMN04488128_103200 [Chitinophaga eiseniae]
MDYKKEFDFLIKSIREASLKRGKRIKNKEIADRLEYNEDYFNTLTGKSGKVTQDHIDKVKAAFSDEIAEAGRPAPGDPLNTYSALLLAMAEDYAIRMAKLTGETAEQIKAEIVDRGRQKLEGFDSWLPQKK